MIPTPTPILTGFRVDGLGVQEGLNPWVPPAMPARVRRLVQVHPQLGANEADVPVERPERGRWRALWF